MVDIFFSFSFFCLSIRVFSLKLSCVGFSLIFMEYLVQIYASLHIEEKVAQEKVYSSNQ